MPSGSGEEQRNVEEDRSDLRRGDLDRGLAIRESKMVSEERDTDIEGSTSGPDSFRASRDVGRGLPASSGTSGALRARRCKDPLAQLLSEPWVTVLSTGGSISEGRLKGGIDSDPGDEERG